MRQVAKICSMRPLPFSSNFYEFHLFVSFRELHRYEILEGRTSPSSTPWSIISRSCRLRNLRRRLRSRTSGASTHIMLRLWTYFISNVSSVRSKPCTYDSNRLRTPSRFTIMKRPRSPDVAAEYLFSNYSMVRPLGTAYNIEAIALSSGRFGLLDPGALPLRSILGGYR